MNVTKDLTEEPMAHSESCKEKLSQNKIEKQLKPFIDQNLQFQLPTSETYSRQIYRSHSPIYSHYMGNDFPNSSLLLSQVNEAELYQAIYEAEQAFEAWKKMQDQLRKAVTNL